MEKEPISSLGSSQSEKDHDKIVAKQIAEGQDSINRVIAGEDLEPYMGIDSIKDFGEEEVLLAPDRFENVENKEKVVLATDIINDYETHKKDLSYEKWNLHVKENNVRNGYFDDNSLENIWDRQKKNHEEFDENEINVILDLVSRPGDEVEGEFSRRKEALSDKWFKLSSAMAKAEMSGVNNWQLDQMKEENNKIRKESNQVDKLYHRWVEELERPEREAESERRAKNRKENWQEELDKRKVDHAARLVEVGLPLDATNEQEEAAFKKLVVKRMALYAFLMVNNFRNPLRIFTPYHFDKAVDGEKYDKARSDKAWEEYIK